ncbi:MAG TPA: hypothetical protein VFB58_02055 [Chloroflexota bacterium]|nr:hypothetical protein [Chloroflexota bacterium]
MRQALLLALLLLAGCGNTTTTRIVVVTATPRPNTNPAAFALRLSDVPSEFIEVAARFHSSSEVASSEHVSLSALRQHGRITSYETQFVQHSVNDGMLAIDDVVSSWRTVSGADWDYHRVVGSVLHAPVRKVDVSYLLAPSLGEERTALSFRNSNQASNLTDYAVIFRRGTYRVYLQVVAVAGTVGGEDVLHLARVIDRRLQEGRS